MLQQVVPEVSKRALESEAVEGHRALPPHIQLEARCRSADAAVRRRRTRLTLTVQMLQPLRTCVCGPKHGHAHRTLGRERSSEQGALVAGEEAAEHRDGCREGRVRAGYVEATSASSQRVRVVPLSAFGF